MSARPRAARPSSRPRRSWRAKIDPGAAQHTNNLTLPSGASFTAIRFSETSTLPPDGSAAAGPTQFIAIANGRIRSFVKTGTADGVLNAKTSTFFASVKGSGNPFGGRIRFDRLSGRWFITMATDAVPGRVVIASSSNATITSATVWTFSSFDDTFLTSDCTTDAPSLGVDASALYIGANQFCTAGTAFRGSSAWVVRKSSVLDGATPVVTAFHDLTGGSAGAGPYAPQGVNNDDAAGTTGYFLGVDNAVLGMLSLRRVSNPGATPTISANIAIPVAATALPIPVRHKGNTGGANGYLSAMDDRLGSIYLRAGHAWVAHTIGVTDAGVAGNTRDGVRWYEIGSLDTTPAVLQSGTLNATTAPGSVDERNYWNASIATSALGRTVVGFSAAGTNEFVNAGVADRVASDAAGALRAPTLVTAATTAYNPPADPGTANGRRWGGYSETVMDTCDGTTIWSLQQFVDTTDSYGLQAARVLVDPPPTPVSVVPSAVTSGLPSVDVVVTGAPGGAGGAFFESPAGFACRIAATISGVTINSVTVNSATSVTLNLSTVNSQGGIRAVTITNPDGQSATGTGIFNVLAGPSMAVETPVAGTAGQPLLVRGWAIDALAGSGSGVDVVQIYATPAGGAPVLLGTATYGSARPDVAQQYGSQFVNSGFSLRAASTLTPGPYTITVYSHSTVTGTFDARQVAVTLSGPVAPFGVMDTPAANATVAGEMGVTGWALDDGGIQSVDVYRASVAPEPAGQVFIGHATFVKGARPDLQALYPSYPDSDSAGWGLMVLTNMLPNAGNGRVHASMRMRPTTRG